MSKYNINKNTIDTAYPYNLVELSTYVDGKLVQLVYTVGIPNTEDYGNQQVLEIYFYSNKKQLDIGEFYKSVSYSTIKNNFNKIPTKYSEHLQTLISVYKDKFNMEYKERV